MVNVVLLLAVILGLLLLLEILNAFYDAMLRGHLATRNAAPGGSGLVRFVLWPVALVRRLVVAVMGAMTTVSLWFHEIAHAAAGTIGLGMPRIVMCRGGGFAQPRPWPIGQPGVIAFALGQAATLTLICLAPLIFGAALIAATLLVATPLEGGDAARSIDALTALRTAADLRALPAIGLELGRTIVTHVIGGGLASIGAVFAVSLTIVSAMTPSSVDFGIARYHLAGCVLAAAAAAVALERMPGLGAVLAGIGLAAFALGVFLRRGERRWPELLCGLGALLALFGVLALSGVLGRDPAAGVGRGVAATVVLLGVAVVTYAFFLAFMVALSLVALRLWPLWEGLKAVPGELRRVFTTIAICHEKRMMFQDQCDFCQCTLAQFKKNGCGGKGLEKPKKSGWRGMLERFDRKARG